MQLKMSQIDVQLALILNDTLVIAAAIRELHSKIEYARSIRTPTSRRSQASGANPPSLPRSSEARLQAEDYEENAFTPCNSQCCVHEEEGQHDRFPADWERL